MAGECVSLGDKLIIKRESRAHLSSPCKTRIYNQLMPIPMLACQDARGVTRVPPPDRGGGSPVMLWDRIGIPGARMMSAMFTLWLYDFGCRVDRLCDIPVCLNPPKPPAWLRRPPSDGDFGVASCYWFQ
jgi:hypothetical protein